MLCSLFPRVPSPSAQESFTLEIAAIALYDRSDKRPLRIYIAVFAHKAIRSTAVCVIPLVVLVSPYNDTILALAAAVVRLSLMPVVEVHVVVYRVAGTLVSI